MANKIIIIPNGSIAMEAEYSEQIIDEYKGNPFIEALPPILSVDEVTEKLVVYPNYNFEERLLDKQYRMHCIQRIFKVFQPLTAHLDLESRLSRLIRQSYLSRNPIKSVYARSLQEGYKDILGKGDLFSLSDGIETTGSALTIVGVSGMGKSTALNHILALYPQIIVHSNYKGLNLSMYQLVWLKLDCPFDGSIKGLCIEFFSKIDELLGTNYYKKYGASRMTVDNMLSVMAQIARNTGLGILIIDEIQHLNKAKSGGDQKMLNFFVTLINKLSLPLIIVGTPKALPVLQGDFRQARRCSGVQGDIIWERLQKDQNWGLITNALWSYQWTKHEVPLTKGLVDILYEESQGIVDILVKLYAMAQVQAITDSSEMITVQSIKKVANEQFQLIKPMLMALKSGNIQDIAKYEDISTIDIDYLGFVQKERSSIDLQMKIEALKRTQFKKEHKINVSIKEEAVLKLINLKIDSDIAQSTVEKIIVEKDGLDSNEIVIEAIQTITALEKRKNKRIKVSLTMDDDLRLIVNKGREENKTSYEILKENGFIRNYETDFCNAG